MAEVHAGSWFGLPDFGITEGIGRVLGAGSTPQGGSDIIPNRTTSTPPPQTPPPQNRPPGGGTGGSTATVTGGSAQPTFNPDAERDARASAAASQQSTRESQIRSNIEGAYQPIFAELDRQIGMVPGQRAELEATVNTLAGQQQADVASQKAQSEKQVEGFKGDEAGRRTESVRDLGENIRNLLQGAAFYLGARGAQDSSAVGAASEAITQRGQKDMTKIASVYNSAISALDQKLVQITDLANDQLRKIDDFKTNKLSEVATWATERINNLLGQKASATGEKARALAQMIEQTQQQFISRLQQLDDDVYNYKTAVSTWQTQRAAEMEDFRTKYQIASQYSSNTSPQYQSLLESLPGQFSLTGQTSQTPTGPVGPGKAGATATDLMGSITSAIRPEEQRGFTIADTGRTQVQA